MNKNNICRRRNVPVTKKLFQGSFSFLNKENIECDVLLSLIFRLAYNLPAGRSENVHTFEICKYVNTYNSYK